MFVDFIVGALTTNNICAIVSKVICICYCRETISDGRSYATMTINFVRAVIVAKQVCPVK